MSVTSDVCSQRPDDGSEYRRGYRDAFEGRRHRTPCDSMRYCAGFDMGKLDLAKRLWEGVGKHFPHSVSQGARLRIAQEAAAVDYSDKCVPPRRCDNPKRR